MHKQTKWRLSGQDCTVFLGFFCQCNAEVSPLHRHKAPPCTKRQFFVHVPETMHVPFPFLGNLKTQFPDRLVFVRPKLMFSWHLLLICAWHSHIFAYCNVVFQPRIVAYNTHMWEEHLNLGENLWRWRNTAVKGASHFVGVELNHYPLWLSSKGTRGRGKNGKCDWAID